MEVKHEDLAREVAAQRNTLSRVEANQIHAEKINELQFAAMNTSLGQINTAIDRLDPQLPQKVTEIGTKLDKFMERIEGLMSGEVQTNQTREATELVKDYQMWRRDVDNFRSRVTFIGQVVAAGSGVAATIGILALLFNALGGKV